MTISKIEKTNWKHHLSNKQTIQILLYTSYSTSVAPWTLRVTHLILQGFWGDLYDINIKEWIKGNKKIVQSEFNNIYSQTKKIQILKSDKQITEAPLYNFYSWPVASWQG